MRRGQIERAYKRFWELPVLVVLLILWLAGAALVGLCALAFYLSWLVVRALVGAYPGNMLLLAWVP